MNQEWPGIDKLQARRAFERAASGYDRVAVLQREVGQRLSERLDLVRLQPQRLLDLGCGTGELSGQLLRRYAKSEVIALDFAFPMLQLARRRGRWLRRPRCLCADAEHLPLATASCDLVFSNLALQWCNDLRRTFEDLLRVLRPGGLLLFSTFGPDTLKELRSSWQQVDDRSHVNLFLDMHDLGDILLSLGYLDPVMDAEWMTLTYADLDGLMADLKWLGAHNVTQDRPRGLTGKGRLTALRQAYETFRRNGQLPATYELVYGHAWAPQQRRTAEGVSFSLQAMRAQLSQPRER